MLTPGFPRCRFLKSDDAPFQRRRQECKWLAALGALVPQFPLKRF
jgi:hypothetical protein